MELTDLIGEHVLSGVDFVNEEVKTWGDNYEPCQVMRFRLDGIVYQVVEDPSDGYRSSMREISVAELPITNEFEGVRVVGRHDTGDTHDRNDILVLTDVVTGKDVLWAGTSNFDDYYPSFVANFTPENMEINQPFSARPADDNSGPERVFRETH